MARRCSSLLLAGLQLLALANSTYIAQPRDIAHDVVWKDIRSELWTRFQGCTRGASFAIRFAFHDAATTSLQTPYYAPASGGADGSLLLSDEESARSENNPLQAFRSNLSAIYDAYKPHIGAADLVQFAGSLGIYACSGGPLIKTVVGRKDSAAAAPPNLLPSAFGPGADADVLLSLFADKGFSPQDLSALVGAHTVSQSFAQQANHIPVGGQQDTTPTKWDVVFYQEAVAGKGARPRAFQFDSDVNLARGNETKGYFEQFAANKGSWDEAFVRAMEKMSLLGVPEEAKGALVDCTDVVKG
ncbi:class II peroxidase [Zasmidium cellare ATCC 36951]|uniref:Peroxidase n=1 Tax=Zasmidium cellare ATCC 36951 TaxID=1080233 RepID=A0A6A6C2W7_ZASCE|nr:class II peroxidase [Zasmidium cellare ATCC 36951]KAF2161467.1 class II peroxidase [Zasmidium cellare ATCC 36951]